MRAFLSVVAVSLVLGSSVVAKAEEYDAIDELSYEAEAFVPRESSMLVRLKSGVSYPAENGEVSHLTPFTLDFSYTGFGNFALGGQITWASGNHQVQRFDMGTLQKADFTRSKSMGNLLGTVDYRYQLGNARVLAGAKMGAVLYNESFSFIGGPVNAARPASVSKTVFTAGPSLNVDLPVKDRFFVNVSGDYLFSGNDTQSGTLYAGLGADF